MISTAYIFVIFFIGLIALFYTNNKKYQALTNKVLPCKVSLLNFILFLWIIIISIFITQFIFFFIQENFLKKGNELNFNWKIICTSITTHGTLFLIFSILWYYKIGNFFKGIQNPIKINLYSLRKGILFFLASLPLLGITNYFWTKIIEYSIIFGKSFSQDKQIIVKIYTESTSLTISTILSFLAIVIAPIVEEILFRGVIYRFLKNYSLNYCSLIFNAFIFAIVHYNILSFLPLFVLGILITKSYEKTGDIRVPIVFHACFNANTLITIKLISNFQ